jgi:hypothetical protein
VAKVKAAKAANPVKAAKAKAKAARAAKAAAADAERPAPRDVGRLHPHSDASEEEALKMAPERNRDARRFRIHAALFL